MDIKKINEEFTKILEDGGFALSGTASEVTDLINKLAQEYGDLTIPEFIDKLIEKEKNGEEIVESLNEHQLTARSYSSYVEDIVEVVVDKINELNNNKHPSLIKDIEVLLEKEDNKSYYLGLICTFYTNYNKNLKVVADYEKYKKEYDKSIQWDDVYMSHDKAALSYLREIQSSIPGISDIRLKGSENYPEDGIKFTYQIYKEDELEDELDYLLHIIESMGDAVEDNYKENVLPELRDKILSNYNQHSDNLTKRRQAIQQLKQAKEEANKKTKNTTVKQALSKSSVAKKIQALQNPTPEQLAKILAAIDG